jgi:hypothetical protein
MASIDSAIVANIAAIRATNSGAALWGETVIGLDCFPMAEAG